MGQKPDSLGIEGKWLRRHVFFVYISHCCKFQSSPGRRERAGWDHLSPLEALDPAACSDCSGSMCTGMPVLCMYVCVCLPGTLTQPEGWLGSGKGLGASSLLWSQSRGDQLGPPPCQVQLSETSDRDASARQSPPDL